MHRANAWLPVIALSVLVATIIVSAHAGPDFSISASPTTLNFNTGSSGTSTITLTSSGGFNNAVSLNVTISPTGLSCSVIPTTVNFNGALTATATLVCTGSTVGSYTVIVTGTNGPLSHSTVVNVNVQDFTINANPSTFSAPVGVKTSSTVSITGINGFAGTVTVTTSTNPSGPSCSLTPTSITLPPSPSSTTLSCTGTSAGNYTVAVSGTSGSLSHTASLMLKITDFSIQTDPGTITVNSGDTGAATVILKSLNGFAGSISLSSISSPNGLSCSLSPTAIILTTAVNATLSCVDQVGTYTVTVTGTSGSLSHSALVIYTVQDFTMAGSSPLVINAGIPGATVITLSSINNFRGSVTLTTAVTPTTGLTCGLSPSTVTLVSTATSNLSCTGSAGVYTVTVTGTNNLLSHALTITYTVNDLKIVAATNGVIFASGSSGSVTLVVVSLDGYSGPVTLTAVVNPVNGLTCSLTPTSVTLGTFATSTLTCSGTSGTYQVNVTATGGGLSHSISVTYNVQSNPSTFPQLNLSLFLVALAITGSGLGGAFALKRFNTTTGPFDDFYKLTGGELPVPSTMLIQGEPGSGTTTLGLEMLRHQLSSGKHCGLLTYDAFPSEIKMKMNSIGLDITGYLNDGSLKIIDCYSGLVGDEHAPIRDPVDFTEISIQVTRIIEKADRGPITILLDSLTPIFNNAPAATAINFLRVLAAKVKNSGGIFIMTGTKGSIPEEARSKVEAGVDGVLDIGLTRKGDKVTRALTVKKLAGHQFSASPSEFKIVPDKGIFFKKKRLTLHGHNHPRQESILRIGTRSSPSV